MILPHTQWMTAAEWGVKALAHSLSSFLGGRGSGRTRDLLGVSLPPCTCHCSQQLDGVRRSLILSGFQRRSVLPESQGVRPGSLGVLPQISKGLARSCHHPSPRPSRAARRFLSNPTTTSPSMTVTGVVATPRRSSSSIAAGSSTMFRAWNGMPCWVRNSSTRRQKIQPGWLKTTTDLAIVRSLL